MFVYLQGGPFDGAIFVAEDDSNFPSRVEYIGHSTKSARWYLDHEKLPPFPYMSWVYVHDDDMTTIHGARRGHFYCFDPVTSGMRNT